MTLYNENDYADKPAKPPMGALKRRTCATLIAVAIYLGGTLVAGIAIGFYAIEVNATYQEEMNANAVATLAALVGGIAYAIKWARDRRATS